MKKKIIAIIQAHMSSTRLPGKVLLDINGKPALYRMLERLKGSKYIDDVIIATSTYDVDDILEEKCTEWGYKVVRGSDSDVLERYHDAVVAYDADIYIRMTSDCPLICSKFVDETIEYYLNNNYRYVSNQNNPAGIGLEIFGKDLFEECYQNSVLDYEHEHVTPYMYLKQNSIGKYAYKKDVTHYRITLDTPEDYKVISKVFEGLDHLGMFTIDDIVDFLDVHPEILEINAMIKQKKLGE